MAEPGFLTVADEQQEKELEKRLLDARRAWDASKPRSTQWVKCGCDYANTLSKHGKCEKAQDACSVLLASAPKNRKIRSAYLWNLYRWQIKDFAGLREQFETVELILASVQRMEKYTPYTLSVLKVTQWLVEQKKYSEAEEWLTKLDFDALEASGVFWTVDRQNYTDHLSWSQRRTYYELASCIHEELGRLEDAAWSLVCMLRRCENTDSQREEALHSLAHVSRNLRHPSGHSHLETLLSLRGFSNATIRERYLECLARRFKVNREDEDDNYRGIFALEEEILIPARRSVQTKSLQKDTISASDLASFAFCPASYALQSTYGFETPDAALVGTSMHNQRILIGKHKTTTRKLIGSFSKDHVSKDLKRILDPSALTSLRPLINDLISATLILSGHDSDDCALFYDETGALVGTPDYVFQKHNGERFVIEEKFSHLGHDQPGPTSPHVSHKVQIGTYMLKLRELKLSYGYLLYWGYYYLDPEIASYDDLNPESGPYLCNKATLFRIEADSSLDSLVNRTVSVLSDFREEGRMLFDISRLNSWKCLNCSVSAYCMHKTGTCKNLHLPYVEFSPKCTSQVSAVRGTVYSSFGEAAGVARTSGGTVIRSDQGGFLVRK